MMTGRHPQRKAAYHLPAAAVVLILGKASPETLATSSDAGLTYTSSESGMHSVQRQLACGSALCTIGNAA